MSKNILIKNSTVGLLQFILTAILTLVSVPVFIHKLGLELYGIFAVVAVIGNLNFLTNFGLNSSLLVYIAQQGKSKESDYDIAVTQVLILSIIVLFIVIVVIFKEVIVRNIFSIPDRYSLQSQLLLVYLVIANGILLIGQTYTAVIDALQKIYITSILQFVYSTIYWVGIITVVALGGGLASIGIMALVAAITWLIIVFIISRQLWGKMELKGLRNEFHRIAKKQLTYGAKIYASGLVGFMFEPLSKILLSNFIGLNAVAFFEIGSKLKGQISGILTKLIYPVLPFIANSLDNSNLKTKVYDLSKKLQLIVVPLSIVMGFILTILIKFWLGKSDYEISSVFSITMSVTVLLFSVPILPIYQYLAAKNLADKNMWIQFSAVTINIIVFFAFYKTIGLYSILVSNTLAFLASFSLGNYYQIKYLHVKFKLELPYYIKIIAYSVVCTSVSLIIRYFIPVGLWDLIIYPSLVVVSFTFYVRWAKLITSEDLDQYFETIPYVKNKLSRILVA
jgi:O-antigen/teichoic acid export membrane protein